MPRSKRERIVPMTEVAKKGRKGKEKLIEDVRNAVTTYKHCFVFTVQNMRNNKLKEMRLSWLGSRFFLGKNKVMMYALGLDPSSETGNNTHKIAGDLKGNRGLFFTNSDVAEVEKFFNEYEEPNFARSGFVSTHEFGLNKGILEDQPFSMEPQLRKLGLPTKLSSGKVELEADTIVCKEGDILTPEQCKILEIFGVEMAVMRVMLLSHLNLSSGEYSQYEVTEAERGDAGDYEHKSDGEDEEEEEE